MFEVDDVDDTVARLRERHGAQLVGEMAEYERFYRMCFVRSAEGYVVGLAQKLG
jgi:predicted enzyme related to lactoylglutathione lyase